MRERVCTYSNALCGAKVSFVRECIRQSGICGCDEQRDQIMVNPLTNRLSLSFPPLLLLPFSP